MQISGPPGKERDVVSLGGHDDSLGRCGRCVKEKMDVYLVCRWLLLENKSTVRVKSK